MFYFILQKRSIKSNRPLHEPKLVIGRVLFIEIFSCYMRKFLLIEGYRIGENELNEETPKEK